MKYTHTCNTGSESYDEGDAHSKLNKSERTKETFPMKVGMQCILKSKQTKRWIEPRYSRFKRRNFIISTTPLCRVDNRVQSRKVRGHASSPFHPFVLRITAYRFMALLDFDSCYHNTSVPIKNFTFDS